MSERQKSFLRMPTRHWVVVIAFGLVSACDRRSHDEPGATTIRGGTLASPMARDAVVSQIAHAHCIREARCGHVGPALRYGDHGACLGRFVPETRRALEEAMCTRGMSSTALDGCLRAIHAETCDDVLADVARLHACAASDLCAK